MKDMAMSDVERAERMTRGRAAVMAIAGAVLLLNVCLQFGEAEYAAANLRGGTWLFLIGAWLVILWNGGGLRLRGRMRTLLNDELSLQNRSRAFAIGFYVALGAGMLVYVVNWSIPIATGDAIKVTTGAGLAAALLCYAWLELRWR